MRVLGHHHVAHQLKTVFLSDAVQRADEHVARSRGTEERQPSVTTEGNEVQVALAVDSLEPLGHDEKAPRSRTEPGAPSNHAPAQRGEMVLSATDVSRRAAKIVRASQRSPGVPMNSVNNACHVRCGGKVTAGLSGVILIFALLIPGGASAAGHAARVVRYPAVVKIGNATLKQGDVCAFISASLSSGDFFKHMVESETANGMRFRKGSIRIIHYPDRVTIALALSTFHCGAGVTSAPKPAFGEQVIESLRFEASWEHDQQTEPIKNVRVELVSPLQRLVNMWTYQLTIPSKGVPLAERLRVSVASRDRSELARFSWPSP